MLPIIFLVLFVAIIDLIFGFVAVLECLSILFAFFLVTDLHKKYIPNIQNLLKHSRLYGAPQESFTDDTGYNNYDEPIYTSPEDPLMNNANDVLKVLPKFNRKTIADIAKNENKGYYLAAEDFETLRNNRTWYTTPPDDQQAFIDYLTFGMQKDTGLQFEDLRYKRRIHDYED